MIVASCHLLKHHLNGIATKAISIQLLQIVLPRLMGFSTPLPTMKNLNARYHYFVLHYYPKQQKSPSPQIENETPSVPLAGEQRNHAHRLKQNLSISSILLQEICSDITMVAGRWRGAKRGRVRIQQNAMMMQ